MATTAQIVANQANAKLSTGPKTPEGKACVAQNALRHGLTAKHLVIRPDEQEEFDSFQHELTAELNPQGPTETTVYQDLLHAAWNLKRLRRLEAESCLGTIDDLIDAKTAAILDRICRYQSRAQRAYYKALKELRILQTNRALRALKLHPHDAPAVPVLADIDRVTKQSRSGFQAAATSPLTARSNSFRQELSPAQAFVPLRSQETSPCDPGPREALRLLDYETEVLMTEIRKEYNAKSVENCA
jgi:hypothetical protein